MNSDRSQRRAWLTTVAIGLGRQLTKAEAREVEAAWRLYEKQRRFDSPTPYGGLFPKGFVAKFQGAGMVAK